MAEITWLPKTQAKPSSRFFVISTSHPKDDAGNGNTAQEKERKAKEKMAAGGERGHGESWGSGGGCGRKNKMEVFDVLQRP